MLDTQTKKRIDDCRDILVGKLPDPKAQIEQITIGLIYKFMDDMDKEAIELGGKAKFFVDYKTPDPEFPNNRKKDKVVEFRKYAWDSLLNAKVTAIEMLTLYMEAIAGMDKNPNIPQLFRDIFKNAYLPYRDPETLKMFLKTISEFEYTHSEKLGDAFEYLLSVMGSQGDAGQFRTPRHIIDFLVAIVDPGKNDTILDPACGTAGFLISAFKHIKEKNNNELTPDERKKLIRNFVGYDISPDMVRLSLVNLYLHGFSDPHIFEYDTLSSEDRWDETFDVILANPPFMSPKGGIRPHKKFSIDSTRSEVLFVDYIAEHLNPKGKAGIIVPEGVIFQSGTAYKDLRRMLVDNYLYAVISLPAGVFYPYSGVKTSILLLNKEVSRKREEVLFIKIDNDGYNLGAQRNAINGSQLDEAIILTREFIETGVFQVSTIAHNVPKSEIRANNDCSLIGERYKASDQFKKALIPIVNLEEIGTIEYGFTDTAKEKGDARFIRITDINEFGQLRNDSIKYISLNEDSKKYLLKRGDVLVARTGATFGKTLLYDESEPSVFASFLIRINFDHQKILPKFYWLFAQSKIYWEQANRLVSGGGQPQFNGNAIKQLKIPLPSLSTQRDIINELDSFQNIIKGAKTVISNFKPQIDIDDKWEWEELDNICEINPKKSELKNLDSNTHVSFVPMADLNENQIDFTPSDQKKLGEVVKGYTYFKDDDVLLAKVTPCFENGKAGIAKNLVNGIGFGSSEYFVIRANEKIMSTWIYLNLITEDFRKRGKLSMTGTGGLQRVPPDFLKTTQIPLPSIEIQQKVIEQIHDEQLIINANRRLIQIYQEKINNRIAKVWGE